MDETDLDWNKSYTNVTETDCTQSDNIRKMNSYLSARVLELEAKLEDLKYSSSREIINLDHEWSTTLHLINIQMADFRSELRDLAINKLQRDKTKYFRKLGFGTRQYVGRVFKFL